MGAFNVNTIILTISAVITAITPLLLWFMSRKQAVAFAAQQLVAGEVKVSATAAAVKAEQVRVTLKENGAQLNQKLDALHKLGNSDREAMVARLEAMHKEILRLNVANIEQRRQDGPDDRRSFDAGKGGADTDS
jgi:hypothetical protein